MREKQHRAGDDTWVSISSHEYITTAVSFVLVYPDFLSNAGDYRQRQLNPYCLAMPGV
jgi:hypothetical protein